MPVFFSVFDSEKESFLVEISQSYTHVHIPVLKNYNTVINLKLLRACSPHFYVVLKQE